MVNKTINIMLNHFPPQVNLDDLDQKFAYIQVTHVTQYFDAAELDQRKTDFERNNNLKLFMYETPFTRDGRARGQINEQYKRRVILTSRWRYVVFVTNNLGLEFLCDLMDLCCLIGMIFSSRFFGTTIAGFPRILKKS